MNERFSRAGLIARVDLVHEPEFALGNVQVRPALCEVAGPGRSETLEPRVMQVLVVLARAKGGVVSRDELIEACWEGRVVGEDSLTRCIGRLRKLAETSNNAFTLDTVLRVGYRLRVAEAAALARFDPESICAAVPPVGSTAAASAEDSKPKHFDNPILLASLAAAACVAVLMVAFAIGWFRPAPPAAPNVPLGPAASVAVLPFVNMSGDPSKEYFSDGFTEEVLDELSNDPRLQVAARTSAFAFKGKNGDIATIARGLHVRSIVEGSVREFGNRVRITAELIDSVSGYRIWSARYDRDLSDILSLQDEVARAIAVALTQKILPSATPRPGKIDPAVYRLYLEARNQLDSLSEDGFKKAYALLQRVTAKEPDFSGGWARLSLAAWEVGQVDALHQDSTLALAHEAAAKALVLDPHNWMARGMQAQLELDDWDWSAAASDFRTLRVEYPNNSWLLSTLRVFYNVMGFPNEALEAMRRDQMLNPLSDGTKTLILYDLTHAGRYGEAIGVARVILANHPDEPWPLMWLCQAYAGTGQIHAAREVSERLRHLKSTDVLQNCDFAIDAAAGDVSGTRAILNNWVAEFPDKFPNEVQEASDIAKSYVELNDFDRANGWYKRAYDRHEMDLFADISEIDHAKYRQTAGFKALSQRPGFKAWQVEHDRIAAELAARHGAP
jgi:TolB-like protein/DNA-binding winged helix-turn-helix (wHTH) protein